LESGQFARIKNFGDLKKTNLDGGGGYGSYSDDEDDESKPNRRPLN